MLRKSKSRRRENRIKLKGWTRKYWRKPKGRIRKLWIKIKLRGGEYKSGAK